MSIDDYMRLPYTIILKQDEDGDCVATVRELRGCIAHGATELEALQELDSMKRLWLESCIADGDAVPLPESESALPSGKWLQRVPKSLHAALIVCANQDEVSLNQLVVMILAQEVGRRQGSRVVSSLEGAGVISLPNDPWSASLPSIFPRWDVQGNARTSLDPVFVAKLSSTLSRGSQKSTKVEVSAHDASKHSGWN